MASQAPAALGHKSKLGSAWGPAQAAAPDAEPLGPAVRLRAALVGVGLSLVLIALCALVAVLLSTALFDGNLGGLW